jgi:DNA-binding response OmpR family regulator
MDGGQQPRALVIDDESHIRELLCDVLTFLGYHADRAANGAEGLALFDLGHYDLVVTDLVMPGITGWEVAETARRRDPAVGVIMITGLARQLDADRVRERGLILLHKPVDLEEFKMAVDQALRARAEGMR